MSTKPKPIVVHTEDLDSVAVSWLAERCEVVRCPFTDTDALSEILPRADALIVRTYTCVDESLLCRAPKLRVVARAGVGLDNVDVPACRARGVEVVYTPDANGSAVVELVFAQMLDALRPRVYLENAIEAPRWSELRRELIGTRQLEGLTLGILGLGRVGTRVARVARAFGMRVLFHDIREIAPTVREGALSSSQAELLRESHVLTIHVDGRPANRHLIDARALSQVRPDVLLINASRGMVVDHSALGTFLRANPGATAMLDVHDPEPIDASHPLLGLPGAHLTPHIGAATTRAHLNMSWVVRDVWRVLCGETPECPAPLTCPA
jgi:D-3-phosphoglycerate dehydrogenase